MKLNTHKKKIVSLTYLIVLTLFTHITQAQNTTYPVYPNCDNSGESVSLEDCFLEGVKTDFDKAFHFPSTVEESTFSVVFSATKKGVFQVLYVSSSEKEIIKEVKRVFSELPHFVPATYNGFNIDKQFVLPYYTDTKEDQTLIPSKPDKDNPIINTKKGISSNQLNDKYNSNLRIPYSNSNYMHFEAFDSNAKTHTAVKPYTYHQVSDYINMDSIDSSLLKKKTTWWGRKFWNENMLAIKGDNYWFHLDPVADLQLGKDNSDIDYTYNNTRAVRVEGGLGHNLSFSSSIFESQGRFAKYFNSYAKSIRPVNQAIASVPSHDISKLFGTDAFDYPMATGSINYTPAEFIGFQFGHDKNFIGDGYHSLFLSDAGSPYTFLKVNTKFWNIQYTNLWTWLRDTNSPMETAQPYKRKFMALHYLSWNATKRLNIGLFESVTWVKTEDQGFDVQYLNPVIIYRAIEYSNGSVGGNAMLGLSGKYIINNSLQFYSQFVLDELTMKEFVKGDGYWANKYGIQLGAKYYNAFKIPNLSLQVEYNLVRPYTYSHYNAGLNYAHVNQPLAHLWGGNFKQATLLADYKKERWFGNLKLTAGIKGFDINSDTDAYSYGGDILRLYTDRNANYNIETGQGNTANIIIGEFQTGYLLNPATNLKIFSSIIYRKFDSDLPNVVYENKTTTWFNIGFRTDINNWHFGF